MIDANQPTAAHTPPSGNALPPHRPFEPARNEAVDMAKDWVRTNQTPAMIGAFALGVFIGAMLRR